MNHTPTINNRIRVFVTACALSFCALHPAPTALAASLELSQNPLGSGNGSGVKPNLLYILDTSGSMASDFLPDATDESICQRNMDSVGSTYNCDNGDVIYNNSSTNYQYYNPSITYPLPKFSNGTTFPQPAYADAYASDPFIGVSNSANTISAGSKINLGTAYQRTLWCPILTTNSGFSLTQASGTSLAATATSGTVNSLTTSTTWKASQWVGYGVRITSGVNMGQDAIVASNGTNSLTFTTSFTGAIVNGVTFVFISNPDGTSPNSGGDLSQAILRVSESSTLNTLRDGNNVSLISGAISYSTSTSVMATKIATNINSLTSSTGYSATASGNVVTILLSCAENLSPLVNPATFPSTGYSYPNTKFSQRINKSDGHGFYYVLSRAPIWCSDKGLTSCQSRRTASFKYPSFSATGGVTDIPATSTLTITNAKNKTDGAAAYATLVLSTQTAQTITGVMVRGVNALSGSISATNGSDAATKICAAWNLSGWTCTAGNNYPNAGQGNITITSTNVGPSYNAAAVVLYSEVGAFAQVSFNVVGSPAGSGGALGTWTLGGNSLLNSALTIPYGLTDSALASSMCNATNFKSTAMAGGSLWSCTASGNQVTLTALTRGATSNGLTVAVSFLNPSSPQGTTSGGTNAGAAASIDWTLPANGGYVTCLSIGESSTCTSPNNLLGGSVSGSGAALAASTICGTFNSASTVPSGTSWTCQSNTPSAGKIRFVANTKGTTYNGQQLNVSLAGGNKTITATGSTKATGSPAIATFTLSADSRYMGSIKTPAGLELLAGDAYGSTQDTLGNAIVSQCTAAAGWSCSYIPSSGSTNGILTVTSPHGTGYDGVMTLTPQTPPSAWFSTLYSGGATGGTAGSSTSLTISLGDYTNDNGGGWIPRDSFTIGSEHPLTTDVTGSNSSALKSAICSNFSSPSGWSCTPTTLSGGIGGIILAHPSAGATPVTLNGYRIADGASPISSGSGTSGLVGSAATATLSLTSGGWIGAVTLGSTNYLTGGAAVGVDATSLAAQVCSNWNTSSGFRCSSSAGTITMTATTGGSASNGKVFSIVTAASSSTLTSTTVGGSNGNRWSGPGPATATFNPLGLASLYNQGGYISSVTLASTNLIHGGTIPIGATSSELAAQVCSNINTGTKVTAAGSTWSCSVGTNNQITLTSDSTGSTYNSKTVTLLQNIITTGTLTATSANGNDTPGMAANQSYTFSSGGYVTSFSIGGANGIRATSSGPTASALATDVCAHWVSEATGWACGAAGGTVTLTPTASGLKNIQISIEPAYTSASPRTYTGTTSASTLATKATKTFDFNALFPEGGYGYYLQDSDSSIHWIDLDANEETSHFYGRTSSAFAASYCNRYNSYASKRFVCVATGSMVTLTAKDTGPDYNANQFDFKIRSNGGTTNAVGGADGSGALVTFDFSGTAGGYIPVGALTINGSAFVSSVAISGATNVELATNVYNTFSPAGWVKSQVAGSSQVTYTNTSLTSLPTGSASVYYVSSGGAVGTSANGVDVALSQVNISALTSGGIIKSLKIGPTATATEMLSTPVFGADSTALAAAVCSAFNTGTVVNGTTWSCLPSGGNLRIRATATGPSNDSIKVILTAMPVPSLSPSAPVTSGGVSAVSCFGKCSAHTSGGTASVAGSISSLMVDGVNLLSSPVYTMVSDPPSSNSTDVNRVLTRQTLADGLISAINSSSSSTGFTADYVAGGYCTTSNCNPQIAIFAPRGPVPNDLYAYYNGKADVVTTSSGVLASATDFSGGVDQGNGNIQVSRFDLDPNFPNRTYYNPSTGYKYASRTDCPNITCSYVNESLNFARWYSYYRTRIQTMKSAISVAFSAVTDTTPGVGFRVGLSTDLYQFQTGPSTSNALKISDFNAAQKIRFYDLLFSQTTSGATPLLNSLDFAGKVFSGTAKLERSTDPDPITQSCQPNFTFLSTDGMWNGTDTNYLDSHIHNPDKLGAADPVTGGVIQPPYADTANTGTSTQDLADVAAYYYQTDIRPSMTNDVPVTMQDPNPKQHMVTFTMGLGVDGNLRFDPNYDTVSGVSDYDGLVSGTIHWPRPVENTPTTIDDLWHAAVNGHGRYFSAQNPSEVADALTGTISTIAAITGASAAAATSNLQPVAGDNFAYVASFTTQSWSGDLLAKSIDLSSGALSTSNSWSAATQLQTLLGTATTGSRTGPGNRNLFTYSSSASSCAGGSDNRCPLTWPNVGVLGWQSTYFNPNTGLDLTVCPSPVTTSCTGVSAANLFTYLMGGDNVYTSASSGIWAYRQRLLALGDIIHTQPVFVGAPSFNYLDSGYKPTFTAAQAARGKTVYVSANDGFLHAFNADTGAERWAFLPPEAAARLKNLASTGYGNSHQLLNDGTITAADVYDSEASAWKTIIVFGLGAGGQAYYALDVTDPDVPKILWRKASAGLSYGNPVIAKLPIGTVATDGTTSLGGKWVALLTSGYNNTDGSTLPTVANGLLYVVDATKANSGVAVDYFTYTAGGLNSNLAKINGTNELNATVPDPTKNNTIRYVYAGDTDGKMWRFDLKNTGTVLPAAFNLINTSAVAGHSQPITTKPELAVVKTSSGTAYQAIFFGTGQFLQAIDKNDTSVQSVYGIKDTFSNPTTQTTISNDTSLVQQTLCMQGQSLTGTACTGATTDPNSRTVPTALPVDWTVKNGWYVDLPESGERTNVDGKIQQGTFVTPSSVPDTGSTNACVIGGHSWLNLLDINTGASVVNTQSNPTNIASTKFSNSLIVGVNVLKLPNGKLVALTTSSDNKTFSSDAYAGTSSLQGTKRVSWREIFAN